MASQLDSHRSSITSRWGPPFSVLTVAVALTGLTWNRWVDPQVDFGRELYLAWRLGEGDVLYRDLASFSGPLSPTINGALFQILGPGIRPLLYLNMVVLATITTLAYRLLAREFGRWPAAMACVAFLGLCAFGYSSVYGIFNFVAPYSHELTHGILVALVGLSLLGHAEEAESLTALVGVGVCAGLSLLIKPEAALAIVGSLGAGILLLTCFGPKRLQWSRAIPAFGLGLLVAPVGYLLVGALQGRGLRWTGLTWPWIAALNSEVRDNPFYVRTLGLDAPLENVAAMLAWSVVWGGLVLAAAWIAHRLPEDLRTRSSVGFWSFGLVTPFAVLAVFLGELPTVFSPLLLLLIGLCVVVTRSYVTGPTGQTRVVRLSGVLFALGFLAKLGFAPTLSGYGFALGAPALMIAVGWLLGPLPKILSRQPAGRRAARGAAAALLVIVSAVYVGVFQYRYAQRTYPLGSGRDRVLVDPGRGQALAQLVHELDTVGGEVEDPLLVLPEGIYLNYLMRRVTPTPVLNFMPIELILFDEDEVVRALQDQPPADVVWIPKDIEGEYGVEFGTSYAADLQRWLETEYRLSSTHGGTEFLGRPFVVEHWVPR